MQNAPREHSAILSTFIKLVFVLKIFVLSIFEWPLKTGFTVCFISIGAGIQHKVQVGMCPQQRFKSVCASAQSDQSLSFPLEDMLDYWLPIEHPSKTDQAARMWRLIWIFDGGTCQLVHFAGYKPIYTFNTNFNPLCTNGLFVMVWCNKPGMIHCIYWGVTGYNLKIKLYFFLWRLVLS